jgi:hypothetical protein
MANHLVSGHAPPTSLAVLTHSAQTIDQFAPGAMIEESFHRSDGRSTPLCNNVAAAQLRQRKLWHGMSRFSSRCIGRHVLALPCVRVFSACC